VLILLPPSEGKTAPRRGKPLDLAGLSFPELTETRSRVLQALVRLAGADPVRARAVLGLSDRQDDERTRDAGLATAPSAPAGTVYSGVLYDALGLASLPAPAKRRAGTSLLICSALFGALRVRDRIPAYRLSGAVSLPDLGPMAALWRAELAGTMAAAAGAGLVVDLRSSTYASMWHPRGDVATRTVTVRVLQQLPDGRRQVVSHFNKATKGRLVRSLLLDPSAPRDVPALAAAAERYGYLTELHPSQPGRPWRLDLVVTEV
jgi:cytoplasmic iron level regulating protein YaaA (DUF328/UPF0246 family)